MHKKILKYITDWKQCGYPDDIPDEVPDRLMVLGLAPSYKAICFAILKNDSSLQSLGFSPPKSQYYYALKGIELNSNTEQNNRRITKMENSTAVSENGHESATVRNNAPWKNIGKVEWAKRIKQAKNKKPVKRAYKKRAYKKRAQNKTLGLKVTGYWQSILAGLLAVHAYGDEASVEFAHEQLERMAFAADRK